MGKRNKVNIVVKKLATGKETRHHTRSFTKSLKTKNKSLGKSKSTSSIPTKGNKQELKVTSSTVEFPSDSIHSQSDFNPDICFICNKLCEEGSAKASIECSNCGVWLHGSCLDLNNNDLCILNKCKVTFHCVFCKIKRIRQVSTLLDLQQSICQQINSSLTKESEEAYKKQQSRSSDHLGGKFLSANYSGRVRGLVNPRPSIISDTDSISQFPRQESRNKPVGTKKSEDLCTSCGRLFIGNFEDHSLHCPGDSTHQQEDQTADNSSESESDSGCPRFPRQESTKVLDRVAAKSEDLCENCGRLFVGDFEEHRSNCKSSSSASQITESPKESKTAVSDQAEITGDYIDLEIVESRRTDREPPVKDSYKKSLLSGSQVNTANTTVFSSDNRKKGNSSRDDSSTIRSGASSSKKETTSIDIPIGNSNSTEIHHNTGQRTRYIVLIDNINNPWQFRNSANIKREFTKYFPNITLKLAFSQRAGGLSLQLVSEEDTQKVLNFVWPEQAFCGSGKKLTCRRLRNLHKLILKNVDPRKTEKDIKEALDTFTGSDLKVHRFRYQDTGRAIPVISLSSVSEEAIERIRTSNLSFSGRPVRIEEHRYFYSEEIKCFRCHQQGHIARLCPSYC